MHTSAVLSSLLVLYSRLYSRSYFKCKSLLVASPTQKSTHNHVAPTSCCKLSPVISVYHLLQIFSKSKWAQKFALVMRVPATLPVSCTVFTGIKHSSLLAAIYITIEVPESTRHMGTIITSLSHKICLNSATQKSITSVLQGPANKLQLISKFLRIVPSARMIICTTDTGVFWIL